MADSKFFSKKEIAEILSKASEIQLSQDKATPHEQGVSEEELFEIAEEVGIPPQALRQAISNYMHTSEQSFNWLLGSSELKSTVVIDNTVTELHLDQLFPELNTFTGKKGEVEKVGNGYDWEQVENRLESLRRITVLPEKDRTRIIHHVNWDDLRFPGLGLSAILGAIFLMILLKSIGLPKSTFIPLTPLGGIAGYFSFMGVLRYYFSKQKKKFKTITQLIIDTLSNPVQHRILPDETEEDQEVNEDISSRNKTKS
ncbi:hypothetical protein [Gracilimonas mengyeensis]|uniref:Uncharacterized protein n=1 Tax=Gracilimonas mengyeensis TaxID=1302730 RepID=A0A521AAY0_9BACT|nr:hypothetical protein [Gracilimonas mengyeensis]SMO31973.1 hypothetical protein SAMN06265219_10114 [Gracilimonas mengyeensis]